MYFPVRTQMMNAPSREVFQATPWHSDPTINMAKGAFMGFAARSLSNMLVNKALLHKPGYHLVWAAFGCYFGYKVLEFKKQQLEDVEKLRDKLVMRRMMRQAQH